MNEQFTVIDKKMRQGSDEWLNWRELGIGSSDVAAIIGSSPYKTAYALWLEKTGQKEAPDLSNNFAVQLGVALEGEAREKVNERLKMQFDPCLFADRKKGHLRFSCDGFNEGDNVFIEIKCPGLPNHEKAIAGEIPAYYMSQIQYGLLVSGAKSAWYCSYNPNHSTQLACLPVSRNKTSINLIELAVDKFWLAVCTQIPPQMTNKDVVSIQESSFRDMAAIYIEAKGKHMMAEIELKNAEEVIKEFAKATKIENGNGFGVTFQKITRKGSVDYSKIDALKGLDIEAFRKPETSYYKVGFSK